MIYIYLNALYILKYKNIVKVFAFDLLKIYDWIDWLFNDFF